MIAAAAARAGRARSATRSPSAAGRASAATRSCGALARGARRAAATLLALVSLPGVAPAWTLPEHRLLADSALSAVLVGLGTEDSLRVRHAIGTPPIADRHGEIGFGARCAESSRNDHSPSRYHQRDRSVLEELAGLTAARLDGVWSPVAGRDSGHPTNGGGGDRSPAPPPRVRNVVEGYLVHHVAALRFARRAGERSASAGSSGLPAPDDIGRDEAQLLLHDALAEEAVAQGFLADAFAARHLMPPMGFRLASLHPINRRRHDDHYSNQGLYVFDARGDAWQTFGDRLLLWYRPSFAHVFEACTASLRELLLTWRIAAGAAGRGSLAAWADSIARAEHSDPEHQVAAWCASHDGPDYLSRVRMPALMLIPSPAVATWSVRTSQDDGHGVRRRRHYPQLSDEGGHDPALPAADVARLRPRRAYPPWMIPDTLFRMDPRALVRDQPDFANVRFSLPSDPPASYAGVVASAGEIRYDAATGGGADRTLGLGVAPAGGSLLLVRRASIGGVLMNPIQGRGPKSAAIMISADLELPDLGIWRTAPFFWLNHVRLGAGHAWTRGAPGFADGPRYSLGIESPPLPLRFTLAAVTLRLEGQWTRLPQPRRGVSLEVVMQ